VTVLRAEGLWKRYVLGDQQVDALGGLDFDVQGGEFVAIMGPSGSGKSTLLHLLGGLDVPSAGTVSLLGQPFSHLPDRALTLLRRRNIGFVFQFFNLVPTLSAEENILLPILIDGQKPEAYRERLDRLVTLVGLHDRLRHKPDQLSGGEQQRVAIARALLTEPAILLADEPTGNLDTRSGRVIMELLRRSCDDLRQTTVVVTHDPRAASYADRVVFLRDGRTARDLVLDRAAVPADRMHAITTIMESLEA
jgi:putative ABC transport system ATP-binding protein